MKKISAKSRSFIILFILAAIGTVISTQLESGTKVNKQTEPETDYQTITYDKGQQKQTPETPEKKTENSAKTIDTSSWRKYSDENYKFSFSINPNWKVKPWTTKYGYAMLPIDPGAKYDDFKIYVSNSQYFALEGLDSRQDTIATRPQ